MPTKSVAARIEARIHVIRGERVINEVVRRNRARFPEDFMFQLTLEETNLMSQFAISSSGSYGGRRKLPSAFTEHGIERRIDTHDTLLGDILEALQALEQPDPERRHQIGLGPNA